MRTARPSGSTDSRSFATIYERTGTTVNIMTHCNAGWLAFVSHGTATAPMYAAHASGIPIHVWVSETRPRNQGARLTAWELGQAGVPHTLIADNSSGHLMQHGQVDMVIVGSDRTTVNGDVANKIGTYMKAVAARDNGIPFYAALPSSTFDPTSRDGVADIPIERTRPDRGHERHGVVRRTSDRATTCRSGHGCRQLRVRRDPGTTRDRDHHRTRNLRCERGSNPGAAIPSLGRSRPID